MQLLRRDSNAFTQFIDILIETEQNNIVDILLKTLPYLMGGFSIKRFFFEFNGTVFSKLVFVLVP